ncbi:MAG: hypothetical protein K6G49_01480 [Candidatus Saccharibacteria bacterium]|nr:hypothetical protein [Candidatus Saccharibacteria bacterium]
MKETGLRSKTCVVPVAVAAGFGMAGMGLVADGVVTADTTPITDTVVATVVPSCTFSSTTDDETYSGSAANGSEVNNFNDGGVHEFFLFCNNSGGYTVSATPHDLTTTGAIEDVIAYTDNYAASGNNGLWTAEIASSASGVTVTSPVPVGGGTIISSNTQSSADMSFTATYKAYVGLNTPAGTYSGTIVYTLAAAGTSSNSGDNGGNNGGGDNGGGSNSGNEEPNNNGGGGDSGNSGSGTDTNNNASPASNNTYNTYNTYNTTNYSGGGGTGTMSTPVATIGGSGGTTGDTTGGSGDDKSNSETSSGYEQPLGVTTNASSVEEESGPDWTPIIVTGVVLAAAGVAAFALAKDNKDKEEQEEK